MCIIHGMWIEKKNTEEQNEFAADLFEMNKASEHFKGIFDWNIQKEKKCGKRLRCECVWQTVSKRSRNEKKYQGCYAWAYKM